MVGNKIRLGLQSRPTGQAVTNPQWTIPGTTVKSYTQSVNAGTKTDLAPADLQALTIDFFWIDDGSQNVTVTATVAGVALNANVTFTIQRPTVDHFTATTSSVNLCVGNYFRPGTWMAAFQPGAGGGTVGCQWDAQATAPAIGVGQIALTQRIQPNRTNTNNGGVVRRKVAGFVLDEALGIQYSGPQAIANSNSAALNGANYNDSPARELVAADQSSTVNESFELYFMYKSNEADSIWVTLSMLTWQWAGQTTRIGAPASAANNWNAISGASLSSTASARSNVLPQWTTNFGAVPFV